MRDLTVGKESKLILKFATPMLLANIFQQTYTLVDVAIIGHSHIGESGIAAITNAFFIIFSLIALIIGISIGFNIVIAQYFGAKNTEKLKLTIDTLVIFLLVASVIISLTGILSSGLIFNLIAVPKEIMPLAKSYINVYFIGVIAFFGFNGVNAVLRGLGDSTTPLVFMIIASVINIILDYVFIIKLSLNIQWAAIATIIAQGGVFIASVIYLNKTHTIIHFSFTRLRFDKDIFKSTLRIGIPAGLQSTFVGLGNLALMSIINPFGQTISAAYGIVSRIDSLAAMPAMNFAAALSTFVGQNIGANKYHRVKKGFQATLIMTSIIAITVTLVVVLFPNAIMKLFTNSPGIIAVGTDYFTIVCSFYIVFTTMMTIGGVMRGAGDTLVPMFITLFALWGIRIPLAYFLSKTSLQQDGIWLAIPIAWFIGMTFSYIYYKIGKWKNKSIIKHNVVDDVITG
ncbi:MAG: MATE family efflux transporter [Marinilabiliales bacterium]